MANYLLVLQHRDDLRAVEATLEHLCSGEPTQRHVMNLPGGWTAHWVAQNAAEDCSPKGEIFTGFAVDDARQRFLYGASGWRQAGRRAQDQDLPGCYLHAVWDTRTLQVSADLYRSLSVFVTAEPGLTMMSDSAYGLLQLRRRLGLTVTLDSTVATSLLWANAMAAQLLGTRTAVQEITYVPVGGRVHLDLLDPRAIPQPQRQNLRSLFPAQDTDYREQLRAAAVRIASVVHTVALSGPEHARLSLSGGKDSRICLAAALLSPAARSQARFTCTNTAEIHRRDFEVVSKLSQAFGFPLGARTAQANRQQELRRFPNPMGLWATDNALVYFALKIQPYALRAKGPFAITGMGSEVYKGNYGLRSLSNIVQVIGASQPHVAEAVETVAGEALLSSGVKPHEELSAEWHYLLLRNALHGGRFTPATKFGLRPLQQHPLVGLSKLNVHDRPDLMGSPKDIPDDLLLMLSPGLAVQPFDRPSKNRTYDDVVARLRLLGGPVSTLELTSYKTIGSPLDVHDGPVQALARLVDTSRISGRLNRNALLPWVDEAAARVQASDLGREWAAKAQQAQVIVRDATVNLGQAKGEVGRILSLAEVL